jgi:tetratricopeptide (TPR) repeat protein
MVLKVCRSLLALIPLWGSVGLGADLQGMTDYRGALRALADGLAPVARVKALRLLKEPSLSADERLKVASLAVEACIREGHYAEALDILKQHPTPDADYWRGVALLAEGREDEALASLEQSVTANSMAPWARVAQAHAYVAMGREAAARKAVRDLREMADSAVSSQARQIFNELELNEGRAETVLNRLRHEQGGKDPRVQYLRARAAFQLGDTGTAERILRDALATVSTGSHGHDAMTVLLAQVMAKSDAAAGIDMLIAFANSFSEKSSGVEAESACWKDCFDSLTVLTVDSATRAQLIPTLLKWAADPLVPERHAHACFLTAKFLRNERRVQEALGLLESYLALYPGHALREGAIRAAVEMYREGGHLERVQTLMAQWRAEADQRRYPVIAFVLGMTDFARGDYAGATKAFVEAADGDRELLTRRRALYNAAASAVKAGQLALFTTLLTQLQQAGETADPPLPQDGASADDLKLDHLFAQASAGEIVKAETELEAFIADPANESHPRLAEACVTLAEIRLLDQPPRTETAERVLERAALARPSARSAERMDYVRVWLEEARGDLEALTKRGAEYVRRWPESDRAAEVHMKIAEASFREQNFATARTHFEIVATDWPSSPFTEAALYFAGKSAVAIGSDESINAAISLWEDVAEAKGPLAFEARVQQAAAKRLQGDPEQAVKLLDALLVEAPAPRVPALLCDKAEILMSQALKTPAHYVAVSTLLDPVKFRSPMPFVWRARMAYLRALALKAQKLTDEAMEACYDIVEVGTEPESAASTPEELEWLYRTGFLALDYLEEPKQWEPAALLAERLALPAAPQAKEAAAKAARLRLEHFLWDGKK